MTTSNQKETVLYCRLSQDDNMENESNSIQNQKMTLQWYAVDHHSPSPCFYVDDGYSGASFQRPGFQQMMADMEDSEIDIIITKDLPRLNRNQLHTGLYIEECFPMLGVRYIVINDNVDTDSSGSNELMPSKSLFNEQYVRDSNRKIRAILKTKAERGERLGTRAPYGYRKDEAGSKKLVVDEETTAVVRRIPAMRVTDHGPSQIARKLRGEQILCPITYAYQKSGINHTSLNMEESSHWTSSTAANMLENELYLGNTINMRFSTKSYKNKRRMEHPKEEYLVFEGTHPMLVTQEVWDIVQRVWQSRRRPIKMSEQNKYSGLVICANCGSTIVLHQAHTMKPIWNNLTCRTYKKEGAEVCTIHYIREHVLDKTILEDLRQVTAMAREHTMEFAEYIGSRQSAEIQWEARRQERELTAMRKRGAELDAIFKKPYEDRVLGHLLVEQFQILFSDYIEEQERLVEEIPAKEGAIQKLRDTASSTDGFIAKAKCYTGITELAPELLRLFIQRTVMHEKSIKWSRKAMQTIEIHYSDIGFIDRDTPQDKGSPRQEISA